MPCSFFHKDSSDQPESKQLSDKGQRMPGEGIAHGVWLLFSEYEDRVNVTDAVMYTC